MANQVNILMTQSNLQLTLHGGIVLHSETYISTGGPPGTSILHVI